MGTVSLDRLEPMLRARRFDEVLLANTELVDGHFHVSIGVEATAASVALARRPRDPVVTNYRSHAHLIALGADPMVLYGEILGRDAGPQRGRAGSTHLAAPDVGVQHTSAMVAGGVPIALGAALSLFRRQEEAIVYCFFGDGAFGEGVVHECLNVAALWSLPVLLVCENNGAEVEGRANAYQNASALTDIAAVHGVVSDSVDGRDPHATAQKIAAFSDAVRGGDGPRLLEAKVPSWPGNKFFLPRDVTGPTTLDDGGRPRGDAWHDRDDPVLAEVRLLVAEGVPLESIRALDRRALGEMETAISGAARMPVAPSDVAFDEVWSDAWPS